MQVLNWNWIQKSFAKDNMIVVEIDKTNIMVATAIILI